MSENEELGCTVLDLREVRDEFDYLIIDDRYCEQKDGSETVESRLALSLGQNVTVSLSKGLLPVPEQAGQFVFGLHHILMTEAGRVRIVDEWLASYPASDSEDVDDAIRQADVVLESIRDKEYMKIVQFIGSGVSLRIKHIEDPNSLIYDPGIV